jgi:hypothetical protein
MPTSKAADPGIILTSARLDFRMREGPQGGVESERESCAVAQLVRLHFITFRSVYLICRTYATNGQYNNEPCRKTHSSGDGVLGKDNGAVRLAGQFLKTPLHVRWPPPIVRMLLCSIFTVG